MMVSITYRTVCTPETMSLSMAVLLLGAASERPHLFEAGLGGTPGLAGRGPQGNSLMGAAFCLAIHPGSSYVRNNI